MIFNITGANATEYDLDGLQCSATDTSTLTILKTRVRISSSDTALLTQIVKENIKLILDSSLFSQDCVSGDDTLDYTIDFPASSSGCSSCGF